MGTERMNRIESIDVSAFTVPTDAPEADGTLEWNETTMLVVIARSGDAVGVGYSYTDRAAALLAEGKLADVVLGGDVMDVPAQWQRMVRAIRNLGRPGICSTAIAAVDTALWDLKARLLGVPLVKLFGQVRDRMPVYGSGGFTSYDDGRLAAQLAGWVDQGIRMVKMKIGSDLQRDPARVRLARDAIGPEVELFVDANGACDRAVAQAMASRVVEAGVTWFEEPVSSDDLEGLRLVRDRAPAGMAITAGEYGYDITYFRRMLEHGAVDVLQPDATRCAGYTEFLRTGALAAAHHVPLSAHTAPNLHVHACCAIPEVRHIEWFHDHVRVEAVLFDGALALDDGSLAPDLTRKGNGLSLSADAERYRTHGAPGSTR